jgi:hypothetical protein
MRESDERAQPAFAEASTRLSRSFALPYREAGRIKIKIRSRRDPMRNAGKQETEFRRQ